MTKLIELPECVQRFERRYDQRIVITCGKRDVIASECIRCGGFKTAMVQRR